jgi:hypothetical protein
MDREKLRKDLEALQVLALSSGSADFMRSVSHLGEFYWTLHILAELRTGKTVDEVLSHLNDAQVVSVRRAIDHTFQLVWLVMAMVCTVMEAVAPLQQQVHQDEDDS